MRMLCLHNGVMHCVGLLHGVDKLERVALGARLHTSTTNIQTAVRPTGDAFPQTLSHASYTVTASLHEGLTCPYQGFMCPLWSIVRNKLSLPPATYPTRDLRGLLCCRFQKGQKRPTTRPNETYMPRGDIWGTQRGGGAETCLTNSTSSTLWGHMRKKRRAQKRKAPKITHACTPSAWACVTRGELSIAQVIADRVPRELKPKVAEEQHQGCRGTTFSLQGR